jgi:hypothetical protein
VNDQVVFGTDIARELRARDFNGLVLIRSANSSDLDAQKYMADGSVNATLGKAESHKDMAQKIRVAFVQHKRKRAYESEAEAEPSLKAPRPNPQVSLEF